VVGAVYSLDTGKVAWLDGQAKMVAGREPPGASAQQCPVGR
jgi:hypothetical protein